MGVVYLTILVAVKGLKKKMCKNTRMWHTEHENKQNEHFQWHD